MMRCGDECSLHGHLLVAPESGPCLRLSVTASMSTMSITLEKVQHARQVTREVISQVLFSVDFVCYTVSQLGVELS